MRIFQSEDAIIFGDELPVPLGQRPERADFRAGRSRSGFAYCLQWRRVRGAIGFHVFRSMAVSAIRPRSMDRFWQGKYGSDIRHFMLGYPDVDIVVDDYGSRGASMLYYWVLAQLPGGHLVEVQDVYIGAADTAILDGAHFALKPGGGFIADLELREDERPAAVAAAQLPAAQRTPKPTSLQEIQLRRAAEEHARTRTADDAIEFSRFIAPGGFRILLPAGVATGDIDHYSVYIGPSRPDASDEKAMWRDHVYESNPMEQWKLSPRYGGFRDAMNPPGAVAYTAVIAYLNDGTVRQADVALSLDIESVATLR